MEIRVDGWWKYREDGKFLRQIHLSTHSRHLIRYNAEKIASVNCLDNFGRTPLIIACLTQSKKREIKILLELGADVNCIWKTSNPYCKITPLGIAIRFFDLDLAKFLLSRGADPNVQLFNGYTALHLAIICNQFKMVELLVEANADPNVKDEFGYTPLHIAAVASKDILKCILYSPNSKIGSYGRDGETPLHVAAHSNNLENVKLFADYQAKVNYEMRGHWTPIGCAPDGLDVKKLCHCDDSVEKVCTRFKTPDWAPFLCYLPAPLIALMKAIKSFLLKELIAEDGIANELTKFKVPSPVEWEILKESERDCTADAYPQWFWVPSITDFPNLSIQQILADFSLPTIVTGSGSTSYEYVEGRLNNGEIIDEKDYFPCFMQVVRSWGSFTCTYEALALGGLCLKLLLSAGADVNGKDEKGYTPLFVLIEDGYENPAVYLLNNAADPNLRVNGITPLMMASVRGLKEVVLALLERGVTVDAEDRNGANALHMVAYYSTFSPPEVMDALIAKGAPVNAPGPAGITPLHLTAVSMSADRCRILLNAGAFIDVKVFDLQAVDLAFLFMNIAAAGILKMTGDLFKAAMRKDLQKVEKLLFRGAAINCQRSDMGTPLMYLTKPLLTMHAILLLKYEPDYTMKDKDGFTAIHHAVKNKNHCTLVMFLKKWGLDMLFDVGNVHHIDHLIALADESAAPDWVMPDETAYVLRSWKDVWSRQGPDRLAQLINKHFYDYVGFVAVMLKFGWPNAMQYFKKDNFCASK